MRFFHLSVALLPLSIIICLLDRSVIRLSTLTVIIRLYDYSVIRLSPSTIKTLKYLLPNQERFETESWHISSETQSLPSLFK